MTEKYGVINEEADDITVVEDQTVSKQVAVKVRSGFVKAVVNPQEIFVLDGNGQIYRNPQRGGPTDIVGESNSHVELININTLWPAT